MRTSMDIIQHGLFRCAHSRLPDGSWIDWFSRSYLTGFLGLKRTVFWVLIDRFSGSLTDRFSVVTEWSVFWVCNWPIFCGHWVTGFLGLNWPVFWVLNWPMVRGHWVTTSRVSARPPSWVQKLTAIIYRFSEYTKRSCCLQGMDSLLGISRTRGLSSQDI